MSHIDRINRFYNCPCCGVQAGFTNVKSDFITCSKCGAHFPCNDEIADFVPPDQFTTLDNIDYDKFYKVDNKKIDQTFNSVKTLTGSLLSREFDTVLELGAGTGTFTMGLLKSCEIKHALITDISSKMLGVCRNRIKAEGIEKKTSVTFSTNAGETFFVNPGSVDLAVGYFVVHHVLDYKQMLESACNALSDDGIAIFVEPNLKYHQAMFDLLFRLLRQVMSSGEVSHDVETQKVINFLHELHFNIKYRGNVGVLKNREDKHMFDRKRFEHVAKEAGFERAETIPFGFGDEIVGTATTYFNQLVDEPLRGLLLRQIGFELPGPFALMDREDLAPSYVFVLHKKASGKPFYYLTDEMRRGPDDSKLANVDMADVAVCYDLAVSIKEKGEDLLLSVTGWAFARRAVQYVIVKMGDLVVVKAPVVYPHIDVYDCFKGLSQYKAENLLFSGVACENGFTLDDDKEFTPQLLQVEIVLDTGQVYEVKGESENNGLKWRYSRFPNSP